MNRSKNSQTQFLFPIETPVGFPRSNRIKFSPREGNGSINLFILPAPSTRSPPVPDSCAAPRSYCDTIPRCTRTLVSGTERERETCEQIEFIWPRNNLPSRNYGRQISAGRKGKARFADTRAQNARQRSSCPKLQRLLPPVPFQRSRPTD